MSTPIIQLPMAAVNEQSESYVNLNFTDQNGNPYTPATVQYRIDAIRQNLVVLDWTTWGGTLGTSITIVIPEAQNVKADTDPVEWRQVSVKITTSSGSIRNDQQVYALIKIPVRTP